MNIEKANLLGTATGILILFAVILLVTSRGSSKKDQLITPAARPLQTGPAILAVGAPICENASWVWKYTRAKADNNMGKMEAALEHCSLSTTATQVIIESWSDKQRIAKISSNNSTGYTQSDALEQ